jgi:hypothetical protein
MEISHNLLSSCSVCLREEQHISLIPIADSVVVPYTQPLMTLSAWPLH